MKKFIFLLFCAFFLTKTTFAQQVSTNVDTSVINSELRKRGLSEEEVRQRLEERGIDIDNIRPQDLPRVQKQIEEIVAELEKEKKQKLDSESAIKDDQDESAKVTKKDRKVLDIDEDSIPQKRIKPIEQKKKMTEDDIDDPKISRKKAIARANY